MTKNIPHDIHTAFILHRDSISKFFIETAYEFLAGLFECYHPYILRFLLWLWEMERTKLFHEDEESAGMVKEKCKKILQPLDDCLSSSGQTLS